MRAMSTPPNPASLSVSLVLYQSDAVLLDATLASLEKAVARASNSGLLHTPVAVAVVDNASPAGYRAQVEPLLHCDPQWLRCSWQSSASNRGFGGGHNLALDALDSEYHLVLNPDVELAPDALQQALASLHPAPDIALMAPAASGSDGATEFLCKRQPSLLVLLARASGQSWLRRILRRSMEHYEMRELADARELVDVPLASGCCMLLRTRALQAVGGFDEQFFMYFEDFDLSLRIAEQGRVVFNPAMRIVHHGGYTASKGWQHIRLFCRSGIQFFNRYGWRLL
ncbi:glycosyltransferase family 2 protein [Parahaliea aestuarii]|uniref:Glycosyltransferase n=1 Tax=Parahaliea aestuarii TaxID=1852021 RepID=A0A5C8ZQ25_9GAMM|nr:glycosyltransferase family 2 protein [Parahaliea aestuarii]TXS89782.1 glycosyltransferase [Parahaliea aestuarii]